MIDQSVLDRCLADIESRLDTDEEMRNEREWLAFVNDEFEGDFFTPSNRTPRPPRFEWPKPTTNQAIADTNAMIVSQFSAVSQCIAEGHNKHGCVRCNYGTGIMPTLFGCDLFLMDEATNTLPAAIPFNSTDTVRALVDAGVPDIRNGLGAKVFETAERFKEEMAKYPKIQRYVSLIHPDCQGPIDIIEVVWGSEFFYAISDDVKLFRDFLGVVVETYVAFMREWYRIVPRDGDISAHWWMLHKGALMLRNDSLMNLSPAFYAEHIRPADQRLFDEFGGGVIHFCGRGDHFIEPMSQIRGLTGINLSEPHLNDMEVIYRNTVDKGIKIIGMKREWAEKAGRPLRGQVHCP